MSPINALIISSSIATGILGVLTTQPPQDASFDPIEQATVRYTIDARPKEEIKLEQMTWESTHEVVNQQNREALKTQIDDYRNTYFPLSPVTSDMILNVSEHYGIPVGFILAVGHSESHMGTKGRAVETMNPMNVGNTDSGDYKSVICGAANNCLSSWEEGLSAFAKLIKDCYFYENETISLKTWMDRDFRAVRCGLQGKRYMSNPNALYVYQARINDLQNFNIKF